MFARIAVVVVALFTLAAQPARADFADTLLDKLKSLPTGINPDYIEMAHYAIKYPSNAELVFARAAAQDYPFFALVGAVKLARDRSFPKIGTFTEAKCMTPITAIDEVFSKADSTIDSAQGKSSTSTAMGAAKSYAANYAKATTAEAKQQAIDELAKNVPYFKDIAVICHFAFRTEFATERNLQNAIGNVTSELRAAYNSFKNGDIAAGIGHVVAIGVTPELVCSLVDQAVSGGAISNTPVIGQLAQSVCSGIAGKVINGLKKVGSAAVCAVESLWGGCDDDSPPPPPPTGISEAAKFCAPYGGIQSALSKTNQPNDYSVICNDGSRCIVRPGQTPRCSTGAQIAAHKAEVIKRNAAEFTPGLVEWIGEFDEKWTSNCPDAKCRGGMAFVRTAASIDAKKQHEADPEKPWHMIAFVLGSKFDGEAKRLLEEAKVRSATKMADSFEELVVAKWSKDCADQICVENIKALAQKANDETLALQKAKPDMSNLELQGEIGRKYAPQYQAQVNASKKRVAILADPNAPPADKMWAMGCNKFLGRPNQYLCEDDKAWQQCAAYVKANKAELCMSPKRGPYADQAHTVSLLKSQGCERQGDSGLAFRCAPDRPEGMTMCGKLTANGIAVQCAAGSLADSTVPPAARLANMGCKSFLGRANQYLCEDEKAWKQCVEYVKVDKADVCMSPKFGPYADPLNTVAMLKSQGCAQQGATGLNFTCAADKPKGMEMCNAFKANGIAVVCNVAAQTPAAHLASLGCKSFLGRANQYLCGDDKAWRQCIDYVKSDKADVCMSPARGPYADVPNTVALLKSQGCAQQGATGLNFTCAADKPKGMEMCNAFKANGIAVMCSVASAAPAPGKPAASPAATLSAMGCKSFLGRANQYLCEDDKAWLQCVNFVKANKADVCMSPRLGPYADAGNTVSMLKGQGCTQQGSALVFKCAADRPNGLTTCNKFKANGVPGVVCNK